MEKRRIQSKARYVVSFLIGAVVFFLVIGISYSISYLEFQRVSNLQGDVAYKIFEDKLDYSLFGEGRCSQESFDKISKDLHFQGKIIDDLEKKFGKNNNLVLSRKKFYTLIELEHFEFVKDLNEKCNLGMHTILFFYSNLDKDLGKSEDTGDLLGVVYSKNPNLIIYSFDINLDTALISKLKEKYSIEESLTIIIDEKAKVVDPSNIKEVEENL